MSQFASLAVTYLKMLNKDCLLLHRMPRMAFQVDVKKKKKKKNEDVLFSLRRSTFVNKAEACSRYFDYW